MIKALTGENMTAQYTFAQLEEQINTVVTRFEKELWGRGPKHIRTRIAFDTVLIKVSFDNLSPLCKKSMEIREQWKNQYLRWYKYFLYAKC